MVNYEKDALNKFYIPFIIVNKKGELIREFKRTNEQNPMNNPLKICELQ